MSTRADYYLGKGPDAVWLASIACDGYPEAIPHEVRQASTPSEYLTLLSEFFKGRDDVTLPEQGWPWPWKDSSTTDYAYTFMPWQPDMESGCVWFTTGYRPKHWWKATLPEPDEEDWDYDIITARCEIAVFPDMSHIQNVIYGPRSGLFLIAGSKLPDPALDILNFTLKCQLWNDPINSHDTQQMDENYLRTFEMLVNSGYVNYDFDSDTYIIAELGYNVIGEAAGQMRLF